MALKIARPSIAAIDVRIARVPPKVRAGWYGTQAHRDWAAKVVARAGGRCQDRACKAPGRPGRLYADHVVELTDGGDALDLANGLARCASCHTRKTIAVRDRRLAPTQGGAGARPAAPRQAAGK